MSKNKAAITVDTNGYTRTYSSYEQLAKTVRNHFAQDRIPTIFSALLQALSPTHPDTSPIVELPLPSGGVATVLISAPYRRKHLREHEAQPTFPSPAEHPAIAASDEDFWLPAMPAGSGYPHSNLRTLHFAPTRHPKRYGSY